MLAPMVTIALSTAGCHNSSSGGGGDDDGDVVEGHSNIVLRDGSGDPLLVASTVPYSPRQTCGPCHDIDAISNGFHFQQGRTDAHGSVHMVDDFFDDDRPWLKSDGMYGKW
jgi:hypothetical protein